MLGNLPKEKAGLISKEHICEGTHDCHMFMMCCIRVVHNTMGLTHNQPWLTRAVVYVHMCLVYIVRVCALAAVFCVYASLSLLFVALTLLLRDPSPAVRASTAEAMSLLCDY